MITILVYNSELVIAKNFRRTYYWKISG